MSDGKPSAESLAAPGIHPHLEAAILADPLDFISWTALLNHVEQHATTIHPAVRAFDWFLGHFPLCWGYWCKYADLYRRLACGDAPPSPAEHAAVVAIYERGVAEGASRYSVDMWQGYCTYMQAHSADAGATRAVFEAALAAVGANPSAGPLWSMFAVFERAAGAGWERVCDIYTRALSEYLTDLPRLLDELRAVAAAESLGAEEAAAPRLAAAAAAAAASAAEVARRAPLEARLVRPFFHVKPLDATQLAAWRALLDLEEAASGAARVAAAYERCLVACANYAEFWARYALWTARAVGAAAACNVAGRACAVLRRRPDVHLLCAELLEAAGYGDAARGMYARVLSDLAPGLLEAAVRLAALERRRGDAAAAVAAYRCAL
ncbi:hypothetical protein JKP88DRAFT_206940, partial [Tribonema minus]